MNALTERVVFGGVNKMQEAEGNLRWIAAQRQIRSSRSISAGGEDWERIFQILTLSLGARCSRWFETPSGLTCKPPLFCTL